MNVITAADRCWTTYSASDLYDVCGSMCVPDNGKSIFIAEKKVYFEPKITLTLIKVAK